MRDHLHRYSSDLIRETRRFGYCYTVPQHCIWIRVHFFSGVSKFVLCYCDIQYRQILCRFCLIFWRLWVMCDYIAWHWYLIRITVCASWGLEYDRKPCVLCFLWPAVSNVYFCVTDTDWERNAQYATLSSATYTKICDIHEEDVIIYQSSLHCISEIYRELLLCVSGKRSYFLIIVLI